MYFLSRLLSQIVVNFDLKSNLHKVATKFKLIILPLGNSETAKRTNRTVKTKRANIVENLSTFIEKFSVQLK